MLWILCGCDPYWMKDDDNMDYDPRGAPVSWGIAWGYSWGYSWDIAATEVDGFVEISIC